MVPRQRLQRTAGPRTTQLRTASPRRQSLRSFHFHRLCAQRLVHGVLMGLLLWTQVPAGGLAAPAAYALAGERTVAASPVAAVTELLPDDAPPEEAPPPPPAAPEAAGEVRLALAAPVVTAGGRVALTATVTAGAAAMPAGLTLALHLPAGLEADGPLEQAAPALAAGEAYAASVSLVAGPGLAAGQVLSITASLTGGALPAQSASVLLGVAAGEESATLDGDGAVVQDSRGQLTLLVTPAMAETGATFSYRELYRWQPAAASQAAGQETAYPLYLPWLAAEAGGEASVATTPPGDEEAGRRRGRPLHQEQGLHFYWQWELAAQRQGQAVSEFQEPVALVVSVAELVAQGEEPATFQLWTRRHSRARWQRLAATYDPERQQVTAWLAHFSQFGLGAGLEASGDQLPSVKAFTVDELNGGASLHIPLDTPAGLGGLGPQLGLRYASVGVDDLARTAGEWEVEVQASGVGLGWQLAGVSYIARSDSRLDDDTPASRKEFALVLNGQRVGVQWVDGQWRTNPELFARVSWEGRGEGWAKDYSEWTVTTADGVTYRFGDAAGVYQGEFLAGSATATFLARTDGGRTYRLARRWYLREVTDGLGNRVEYRYRAERGWERSCVSDAWEEKNDHWYIRDISLGEVLWSGNPGQGVGPKLRVLMSYSGVARWDQRQKGTAENDCLQPLYGTQNQLSAATVQAWAGGGWQTLVSYHLSQGYRTFQASSQTRLVLEGLEVRGSRGGEWQRYRFGYDALAPNRILLRTADNGLGCKVTYSYTRHRSSCSNGTCPGSKLRYAVTRTVTENGQGEWVQSERYYGPVDSPGGEWSAVADDGGFLGFQEVQMREYDANTGSEVLRRQVLTSYGSGASGSRANPDPRRGKVARREVWDGGGALLASRSYGWAAYRWQDGGWDEAHPTERTWEVVNEELVTPLAWLRLESERSTVGSAVDEERYYYQASRQNGMQYGNLTQVEEWADGVLQRTTVREYYPNAGGHMVNRVARERVFAPAGKCWQEVRTVYDNTGAGYRSAPVRGLVAKVERALAGCSESGSVGAYDRGWQVTHYSYDGVGNVTRELRVGDAGDSSQDATTHTEYDGEYRLFAVRRWSGQVAGMEERASYYGVNEGRIGLGDGRAYWGQVSEVCGVNGVCTRQSYDEHGRRVRRWEGVAAGSGWGSDASAAVYWGYRRPYELGEGPRTYMEVEWRAPRCRGNFVRRHYDGLGQLVLEQRADENWELVAEGCGTRARLDEVDVAYGYDGLGRVNRVSAPRRVSSTQDSQDPNIWWRRVREWSVGSRRTSYDGLGRVVVETAANGGRLEYGYRGRALSVVAKGRGGEGDKVVGWQAVDGLGRLSAVRSYRWEGSRWALEGEVRLAHNVVGGLERVELASGGVSEMRYDVGGRKVWMADGDLGQWSYGYDRQGRLVRQTDGRGVTQCLGYDRLGRLVGKDLDQGSGSGCAVAPVYEVSYAYDGGHSGSNRSRGQLTRVSYRDGRYRQERAYNGTGQLAKETVTIAGAPGSYSTSYGYDGYRRLERMTYPDGEEVRVTYNGMGLPVSLVSSSGAVLADSGSYDGAGRLVAVRYPAGGNLWRTQEYAPYGQQDTNGGKLTAVKVGTSRGTSNRLALTYSYDSYGNVKGLKEGWNGQTQTSHSFGYDYGNRVTGAYGRSYAYDGSGRLTQYEGVSQGVSGSFPVHGVKGAGYAYDGNGNLVRRNAGSGGQWQRLEWDRENRLAAVKNDGGSVTLESYVYAADGRRVKKGSGEGVTYYPFAHYEVKVGGVSSAAAAGCGEGCGAGEARELPGGAALYLPLVAGGGETAGEEVEASAAEATTVTKYYFFGEQRIAMRRGGVLTYLHGDALGSTVLETNASGGSSADQKYYAYGRQRDSGGPVSTEHRFTGQKVDGSGLMYYHARYYDPQLGRFISPDTLVPDPTNLQDYNRYAYARGNPLQYNDPSGHCADAILPFDNLGATMLSCGGGGGGALGVGSGRSSRLSGSSSTLASAAAGLTASLVLWVDKLPAVADRLFSSSSAAEQGVHSAGQNAGNTADPGGIDPQDPFRNATAAVRSGVETLRRQIDSPFNRFIGRYGAQAHLSRAEHYQQQGKLQSVNPTGKGSIDLVLNNNVGVEVKYWQASTVFQDMRVLARQLANHNNLGLQRIVVEFVQTQRDPVTQAHLAEIQRQLVTNYGLDTSKFSFTVVANPGIP